MLIPPMDHPSEIACTGPATADMYLVGIGILAGVIAITLLFFKSKMSKSAFYTLFISMVLICILYSFNFEFYECGEKERMLRLFPETWKSFWFRFF
jgi:hypothetical protein